MKLRILVTAMGFAGMMGSAYAAQPATTNPTTTTTQPTTTSVAVTPATPATKAPAQAPTSTSTLATDKDKLSYAIGMDLGENFKSQSIDINPTILANGVKDAIAGGTTLMTSTQREETLMKFQKEFRAKQEAEMKKMAEKNKLAGDAFLASNKAKPGVITLANGLQYKVIEAGTGPIPTDKDVVAVEYEGSLINGKVFDSSAKQGKPAVFPVGEVIPGWREALKLMKVGSKWELVIPPSLAYGERGVGDAIGPNETLVFKVKLLKIESKDKKATDATTSIKN